MPYAVPHGITWGAENTLHVSVISPGKTTQHEAYRYRSRGSTTTLSGGVNALGAIFFEMDFIDSDANVRSKSASIDRS